ncbi:MAG: hypothetical protein ABSC92_15060 [Rhizomicrobium sp.]|jgi:hypothetical protein
MPLRIDTFRNDIGGSSIYKAISHPLAAEPARALIAKLAANGRTAIYDPDGIIEAFETFYPLSGVELAGYFVQNVEHLNRRFRNHGAQSVTKLPNTRCGTVLIASFDDKKPLGQVRHLLPDGAQTVSFATLKTPANLQTVPERYLSTLNFATNHVFFRDEAGHHTRLVTANYWTRYGAKTVTLWCRLFAADGSVLATWTESCGTPESSVVIDSREIRERFKLPAFTGQLFVHAVGVAGHDIVKYALDTYGDGPDILSATHDANSWPADLYAGLPAPADGEDVILWVQNSHPISIPAGDIGMGGMGRKDVRSLQEEIRPFATRRLSVAELLPDLRWPDQIEIHAGKHLVRPRYEIVGKNGRSRMAHPNVERTDLKNDTALPGLRTLLGKVHLLPAALLPTDAFTTTVLPTPMSTAQTHLPVKALIYDAGGALVGEHRFGNLRRDQSVALDVSSLAAGKLPGGYGHVELVYDFDAGEEADGWLHALFRYGHRTSGHHAETSFGSHVFNTALTYRGEPQSYSGPPPGLSTRLFLRVAPRPAETLCHLIYPVSESWHAQSTTSLTLRGENGAELEHKDIAIPSSGSFLWRVGEMFDARALREAGRHPYVIIRDETCRLFGYHGVLGAGGSFSLDHMFGF